MNSRYIAHISFLLITFATCPFGMFAQAISGDVVGSVVDAGGGAVPDARIEATNVATGVKTAAATNASGQYRLSNLPVGAYDIGVSSPGFTSSSLKNVAVSVNKTVTVNLTMQVGQVSTSVDVTEAASVIDTTTATISTTHDAREARDLPNAGIGIGIVNLSLLGSGVASNGGIGVGEGPSVGGQRPYNNNFTVEGIDNNNKSITGSLLRFIPNDAVAEFTLLQNQFSAEFGHSSGGQFNTIMKSGTNTLHGTLYDYLQNRNLNAIDQAFANQGIRSNPRYDNNRLGASVGGPIIRNKLFYFGNFEYNPTGQSTTPGSPVLTPTADGYAKLSAIPGVSATNLAILKQYATPSAAAIADRSQYPVVGGVTIPVGILPLASPNFQNGYYAVATADYNYSDRDQLRGRYLYNKLSSIDHIATLPAFFLPQPNTYSLATLAEYHNFSAYLTNELRLGYNRMNQDFSAGNFKFPGLDSFPDLNIDELSIQIGPDSNAPQFGIQNTYQLTDNVTWVKGAHTIKFGIEGRKYIAPQSFTQRSRGEYEYSTLDLYLRDISPDSLAQRGLGNVVYYGDQIAAYSYVNDTWRLRPNLTVNLGLRHEYSSVPYSERLQNLNAISSVPGLLDFREPKSQTKNFAPRIGVAYSPGASGRTSIRAGFGLAYDILYDNIGLLALPPQLKTTVDISGADLPNFLRNGGILPNTSTGALTAAAARAATSAYIPDLKVPYSIQWNFGVQHVFARDYTFEARYLGTRGIHLNVQDRINKIAPVTATNSLPTYLQAPSQATLDALPLTLAQLKKVSNILPAYQAAGLTNGAFVVDEPIGNSTYHGLALQLNRRFSSGLQFLGAYTWSHLIDDSTADFNTTALTPRRPQDFQNLRPERSASALDRRHRITFSAIYDVAWFRNSNWMLKNLVGNWSAAPIYTYESPEFVTVQSAVDSNLNGDAASDRAIVNPSGAVGVGSDVTALTNTKGDTVAYLARNPNARYIKAGAGAYANGGRNTLAGRPINNWDLNLIKNFSVTERMRLQFSAQFLNAFNHPQFVPGFVNRVDNPVVLNNGPGVRNYLTPGNAAFNDPESTYGSNPRTIQLALKLIF